MSKTSCEPCQLLLHVSFMNTREMVLDLWHLGMPASYIADTCGIGERNIYRHITIARRSGDPRAAPHVTRWGTLSTKANIHSLAKSFTPRDIARRLGVSTWLVYKRLAEVRRV